MNTKLKPFFMMSLALAVCLSPSPSLCAADPVQQPKKEASAHKPKFIHDSEVVLTLEEPRLRVPLGMEYELRFSKLSESDSAIDPPYNFSVVSSVRFRDDHWIYELAWAPFGEDNSGFLVGDKEILLSPDQSWVALPIYQQNGIYFEKADTLQHSLQTNQPAGFLLECDGRDHHFEGYIVCDYRIEKWLGPHTLLLDLSVGESNATLKVDLEKRTVEGKLPIEDCKLVFGPLKNLCTKKKPSMKPAPSAGH